MSARSKGMYRADVGRSKVAFLPAGGPAAISRPEVIAAMTPHGYHQGVKESSRTSHPCRMPGRADAARSNRHPLLQSVHVPQACQDLVRVDPKVHQTGDLIHTDGA